VCPCDRDTALLSCDASRPALRGPRATKTNSEIFGTSDGPQLQEKAGLRDRGHGDGRASISGFSVPRQNDTE